MERLLAGQVALMENMPQKQIQTVRMAEIAQRLGVASSTISRALRDDPRISSELRNRVRRVAEELGYRPNPLVSALIAAAGDEDHRQPRVHGGDQRACSRMGDDGVATGQEQRVGDVARHAYVVWQCSQAFGVSVAAGDKNESQRLAGKSLDNGSKSLLRIPISSSRQSSVDNRPWRQCVHPVG